MQRRSGKKLRTRSPILTALTVFFLTLISISLASLLFYSLMMNTARIEFKQMAQIVSNATISSEKDQLLDVYAEFHKQNSDFVGWISLNSVYTRSGQNSTPNSNATNLHSSQKRCCSFCISSSNASPTFQVQKSIFHQMTKPIQVTVILPLLLAISFSRNDDIHSSISGISNDLIGVIPTIGQ